jgi:hypothetical protein
MTETANQRRARMICQYWSRALGLGFHPDKRREDYFPQHPSSKYEADMAVLRALTDIDLPRIAWRAVSLAPFPGDSPRLLPGDDGRK